MERNITITLEKAKEWYNSGNESLMEIALQVFNRDELRCNFQDITTLKTACDALGLDYLDVNVTANVVAKYSKASAAMFKLNIVRKALNLDQDLHLTKNPKDSYIYYPCNPLVTKNSTSYKNEIKSGKMEIIGKIKSEEKLYNILGGSTSDGFSAGGLVCFSSDIEESMAPAHIGFLGCATKEIAEHFGKYFGVLITEAKYGDIVDFEIIEDKYQ